MLCMNDQLTAFATAMASTNPDFASLLAQQQLISAAAGSLTTQTTPAIQTHPTSSNSTSPLQNQGGALSANGMKQMTPTQGANSSAPPSQKPSFSLAPISEVEMMKYFNNSAQLLPQPALTQPQQQQQQNQAGAQPAAPQPQKMQTQFLLASAQIDDKKPKMEGQTTTPNVVHHPSPLNPTSVAAQMGQANLSATNPVASTLHHPAPLHPSPLSAQQQVAQLTSPVNAAVLALQQQQNANPQLKRTQPMAVPGQQQQQQQQAQQTAQTTGTIPFNIMQSYQEQLLASMNGPPPAKRHSISAVPLQQQQQTPGSQASVAASLAHPLATLPILQSALNPQFAAAATQASLHAQQHLNALGKAGQASSILQLPTIPPAFVATAQARQNGQEQGMNGLTAAGLTPNNQLLGLPEGLNLQQLQQLFLQQQRNQLIAAQQNAAQAQLRLNGQQNQQLQMPLGTAAATAQALQQAQQQQQNQQAQQQAQQTAQNAAVASAAAAAQNPAMALYHQQFLQMMQQQQKAALAAANGIQVGANAQNQLGAQNAAAQALQAQQQQLQQFLLQQQQANAALVAEQQRRRATIGNPNQLNAVMAAAAANQQQQQQQQQAQPPQMQQMPALGSQLAALMAAAQRNSPAQQAANAAMAVAAANRQNETAPGSTAATVGSNNSPAVVTLDDQGNQPPKLQRVSPTNGGDDVQKLLAQINASNNANNNAAMDANAQQQAILQQFQQQQQQMTQNRLLQIQQQFADAQSSQAQMNANPALSFASPHNPLVVSSSGQLPQSTMASLAASMAQQGQGILSQANMTGLSQANMASLSQGISQAESILSQGQGFLSQGVNTTLQQQQQQLPTPIPISGQQLQIPGQPQMAQNPPISSAAASSANGVQSNGLAPEGSPLAVPKASPAAAGNPSTPGQMTAVSRESASTEPCLVIADDDEQNPVVD